MNENTFNLSKSPVDDLISGGGENNHVSNVNGCNLQSNSDISEKVFNIVNVNRCTMKTHSDPEDQEVSNFKSRSMDSSLESLRYVYNNESKNNNFNGAPLNIYRTSNGSLDGQVKSSKIIKKDVLNVPNTMPLTLKYILDLDQYRNTQYNKNKRFSSFENSSIGSHGLNDFSCSSSSSKLAEVKSPIYSSSSFQPTVSSHSKLKHMIDDSQKSTYKYIDTVDGQPISLENQTLNAMSFKKNPLLKALPSSIRNAFDHRIYEDTKELNSTTSNQLTPFSSRSSNIDYIPNNCDKLSVKTCSETLTPDSFSSKHITTCKVASVPLNHEYSDIYDSSNKLSDHPNSFNSSNALFFKNSDTKKLSETDSCQSRISNDLFLWKLFLPAPSLKRKTKEVVTLTDTASPQNLEYVSELDTGFKSFIEPSVNEIKKELYSPKLSEDKKSFNTQSDGPSLIYIVVRYIPHKITALIPSSILGYNKNEDNFSETQEQYNLTLSQAHCVQWSLDKNEFELDFSDESIKHIKKIIVGDPNIIFSNFSLDIDVQISLKRSLKTFLLLHDMIPIYVNDYQGAGTEHYSEDVLSNLFHYLTPSLSTGFHQLDWAGYRELNLVFLNSLVQNYNEGDWILVFNHNLMLLPKMLRERPLTRNATIGFYLGTVFPSSEMYRILPQREELLKGVLAASFIGFNGFQYKHHFLTACTGVLGIECSGDRIEPNSYVGKGSGARVVSVPRGINPVPWIRELSKSTTLEIINNLKSQMKNRKVILGIDTLDYTKGIPYKIMAFKQFLTEHPEWASKSFEGYQRLNDLNQYSSHSRPNHHNILTNIYQLVGSINALFGSILYQPIHFLLSPLSLEHLVCLYGLADIMFVTPLRESLSWTAYEFVLCQSFTNKGVLILSEFSASAQSLGASAICVNPWDLDAMSSAVYDALTMSKDEKYARHEYAYNYILNYDSKSWGRELIFEFQEAIADIEAECRTIPEPLFFPTFSTNFNNFSHCIIILGVRGTLFPYEYYGIDPHLTGKIRLTKILKYVLYILNENDSTHILIISSSSCSILHDSFGDFRNVTLMAEDGHFERPAASKKDLKPSDIPCKKHEPSARRHANSFENLLSTHSNDKNILVNAKLQDKNVDQIDVDNRINDSNLGFILKTPEVDLSWMDHVEETCKYFEERTPGSFVYRTATSVAWNHRRTQREHGSLQARDLLMHLWAGPPVVTTKTDIVVGPHSVEVRSSATCKADAIEKWLKDIFSEYKIDPTKAFFFCAANFLPRDEDVFASITKFIHQHTLQEHEVDKYFDNAISNSGSNYTYGETDITNPTIFNEFVQKNKNTKEKNNLYLCTVGLKSSRASYLINDDKAVESTLVLLTCLIIKKNGIPPYDLASLQNKIYNITNDFPTNDNNSIDTLLISKKILIIDVNNHICFVYQSQNDDQIRFIWGQNQTDHQGTYSKSAKNTRDYDKKYFPLSKIFSKYNIFFQPNNKDNVIIPNSSNFFLQEISILRLIESYELQRTLIFCLYYYYTRILRYLSDIRVYLLPKYEHELHCNPSYMEKLINKISVIVFSCSSKDINTHWDSNKKKKRKNNDPLNKNTTTSNNNLDFEKYVNELYGYHISNTSQSDPINIK